MAKIHCPHCEKEIEFLVKGRKKKDPKEGDTEMNLQQFKEWCEKSKSAHIRIIAEWAELKEENFTMKSQWSVYITENASPAAKLAKFPEERIKKAFDTVREESKRLGYVPSLKTLLMKITK